MPGTRNDHDHAASSPSAGGGARRSLAASSGQVGPQRRVVALARAAVALVSTAGFALGITVGWWRTLAFCAAAALVAVLLVARSLLRRLDDARADVLRFRAALDVSDDLVILADADAGEIRYANPTAIDVTNGAARPGAPFTSIASRIDGHGPGAPGRRRALEVGDPAEHRWIQLDDDGGARELEAVSRLVHAGADRRPTLVTVGRDVTERRRLDRVRRTVLEQKEETARQLDAAVRMQRSFLQAVSHELRTPLTSVLGFTETLLSRLDELSPERVRVLLDRLHVNAARLEALLADLLDLSQLARGDVELQRTAVDVARLCHEVAGAVEAPDRDLAVDVAGDLVVDLDGPKVARALQSLVDNAVRHTPPGTRIDVRANPVGRGVELVVADDGPGVQPSDRHRIFQPFCQGAEAASSASPGTGVGLAVADRFAQLHGGRAWYADRPRGGAVFGLHLPCGPDGTSQGSGDGPDGARSQ